MVDPNPAANPFESPQPVEEDLPPQKPLGCFAYATLLFLGLASSVIAFLFSCGTLFSAGHGGVFLIMIAGAACAFGVATWCFSRLVSRDVDRSDA